MNKLVENIIENNLPVLFDYNDLNNLKYNKNDFQTLFNEALIYHYIENVYKNIYTLNKMYRKTLVSECVISQIIIPHSYISTYFVLSQESWIPEGVYTITSITDKEDALIDTEKFGSYQYKHLYENLDLSGVVIRNNDNGNYKISKPLRALCDLVFQRKENWTSIDELEKVFRISYIDLETLTSGDFDELQGKFNIKNIENLLSGLRKELQV